MAKSFSVFLAKTAAESAASWDWEIWWARETIQSAVALCVWKETACVSVSPHMLYIYLCHICVYLVSHSRWGRAGQQSWRTWTPELWMEEHLCCWEGDREDERVLDMALARRLHSTTSTHSTSPCPPPCVSSCSLILYIYPSLLFYLSLIALLSLPVRPSIHLPPALSISRYPSSNSTNWPLQATH